jgi:hypothetical protein
MLWRGQNILHILKGPERGEKKPGPVINGPPPTPKFIYKVKVKLPLSKSKNIPVTGHGGP